MQQKGVYVNILFLNREFYEYDNSIENYLKRDNKVFSYSILPHKSLMKNGNFLYLSLLYFFDKKKFFSKICEIQQNKILEDIKSKNIVIDAVFVLAGQQLRREFLLELKKMYPNANFVWYIWDNIKNLSEYENNKKFFHKIISFDIIEAKNEKLCYLPLFYLKNEVKKKQYDIVHIGYAYSKRVKLISRILKCIGDKKVFIFLKINFTNHIKNIFKKDWIKLSKYIHYKPISTNEAYEKMVLSKCVIDIPADNQTGLTMRTIEALGAHTKIITTNKNIKLYDFYNSNNIFVMEEDNHFWPDEHFFSSGYAEIPSSILKRYSFEHWINEIGLYLKQKGGI